MYIYITFIIFVDICIMYIYIIIFPSISQTIPTFDASFHQNCPWGGHFVNGWNDLEAQPGPRCFPKNDTAFRVTSATYVCNTSCFTHRR